VAFGIDMSLQFHDSTGSVCRMYFFANFTTCFTICVEIDVAVLAPFRHDYRHSRRYSIRFLYKHIRSTSLLFVLC